MIVSGPGTQFAGEPVLAASWVGRTLPGVGEVTRIRVSPRIRSNMKKKVLIGMVVALILAIIGISVTPAANATDAPPVTAAIEGGDYGAEAIPKPSTVNGIMFWTGSVCVQSPLNATTYPVAAAAQQSNLRVDNPNVLAINFRADCEASGYTPSRSFTITTFSSATAGCLSVLNSNRTLYNGMYRWTNHPINAINTHGSNCVSTQARRNHVVSMAVNFILGLQLLNSTGWNSRVMNQTVYSFDNVWWATDPEGQLLYSIYTKAYGG